MSYRRLYDSEFEFYDDTNTSGIFLAGITNFEAVDYMTVRITRGAPNAALVQLSNIYAGKIMSPRAIQEVPIAGWAECSYGTGQFKVASWEKGVSVVQERNADSWGTLPSMQTLVFRHIPEPTARVAAHSRGIGRSTRGLGARLNVEGTVRDRAQSTPGATVCFVRRNDKVLLQERAPGRLWAGRLNGPGGKIDLGETPEAAVVREVMEETGLRLLRPVFHGSLDLVFGVPEQSRLRVFVYCCSEFTGRARGGREGALRWYGERTLPYHRLWPDMRYWLPLVLDGGTVEGTCVFDDAGDQLLSCSLSFERGS